jgi:hypothetical protein
VIVRMIIKAQCKRIRRNNGIVEVLLTRYPDADNKQSQEHHVLLNVPYNEGQFEQGEIYLIEISRSL